MKQNVGQLDRIIRAIAGVLVIVAGFVFNSWFGALGLILLATAAIGWCPLYLPFGLSTCRVKPANGR